jgi:hypothetical protein
VKEFLVVYDYGMGGVWGFAHANSEEEVTGTFPELKVVHEIPEWMDPDRQARIRLNSSFTVNDPTTYPEWLKRVP